MDSVVITGASTGIGEAIALLADREGLRVFAGVRTEEAGLKLKEKASERLVPILLDVTKREQIENALSIVSNVVGDTGISGLVNNAGRSFSAPLEYVPIDGVRDLLEVNLIGMLSVTQCFLPLLRKGKGRIVVTSSALSQSILPTMGPYCMSKYAVEAFADVLRLELSPWKIPVSVLQPGVIATPIWKKGFDCARGLLASAPKAHQDHYRSMVESTIAYAEKEMEEASTPDLVAKYAFRALTSSHPKRVYRMGKGSRLVTLGTLIPRKMRDRAIAKTFGLDL